MAHPSNNKGNFTYNKSGRRVVGSHAPWFTRAVKNRRKKNKAAKLARRQNR